MLAIAPKGYIYLQYSTQVPFTKKGLILLMATSHIGYSYVDIFDKINNILVVSGLQSIYLLRPEKQLGLKDHKSFE